ncbi:MAG: hypothetical protein LBI28_05840 [Treponema sp.]|jgi:hypothetical protein|nr:hypothetical protein [Treponema sp.]
MKYTRLFLVPTILVFFLFSACRDPLFKQLPTEPEYWNLKPMGTPLYVYLDEDFNVSEQDASDNCKTAVFIDGNPLAKGVMVLAETSSEEYDDSVRIINQNTNTIISMFFHKDQRFPWSIHIASNDKYAEGKLSSYNWNNEYFSIEFEESGVYSSFENIKLNLNILLGYSFDNSLSAEQNIRLRNIYTALGIYESISRLLPGYKKIVASTVDAGSVLSSVFEDKSIASYAITVTLTEPVISVSEFPIISILDILILIGDFGDINFNPHVIYPLPASPLPLSVTITKDGVPVSPDTIHYIEKEEEIVFEFKFTNFTQNTNVNTPSSKQKSNKQEHVGG